MKRLILLGFVLPIIAYGAPANSTGNPGEIKKQEGVDPSAAPCTTDAAGLKQGMWIIWGKDNPDKGYPLDGRIEEGAFKDDKKDGIWIKYHEDGKTPRLTGDYSLGRPNGQYTKYYSNGVVEEEGTFYAGKQQEVFKRFHENGQIAQEKTFNTDGKEDGKVTMWFPNGQKEFEFTKVDGVTTGTAVRYWPNGDVKEEITYNADGSVGASVQKEMVNPPVNPEGNNPVIAENPSENKKSPSASDGKTNGKKLDPNGYNKIYNQDKELWMDGQFKNNYLWDGKLYVYDAEGILLKIEIWKEGKYHSDGQLR